MRDREQKYYLCKSGEVKRRAEEHRAMYLRLKSHLWTIIETFGVAEANIDTSMMLIRGLCFKGTQPDGWTKPKHGVSYPKRGTLSEEVKPFFTPRGMHTVITHKELMVFPEWLGCPFSYNYTDKNGSGWHHIGRIFTDSFVYWYDKDGPIMLELPDVAGAKQRAVEKGEIVKNDRLDWKPPKGLKEILSEEWDLMAAKHDKASEKK